MIGMSMRGGFGPLVVSLGFTICICLLRGPYVAAWVLLKASWGIPIVLVHSIMVYFRVCYVWVVGLVWLGGVPRPVGLFVVSGMGFVFWPCSLVFLGYCS